MLNFKILTMEQVLFYLAMVFSGALHGFVTAKTQNKQNVEKYSLLGVISFFLLMGMTYWILTTADKDVLQSFFGSIVLAGTAIGVTHAVPKK
jgi:uncharacterized membrane protein